MEGVSASPALSMLDYVASLERDSLPRVLQVCSGVYFQGSIYEVSGSEVCLSTGDLVKVIGTELLSASCEDISTKDRSELPLDHAGLFKLVLEDRPYSTVQEIVDEIPVEPDASSSFSFSCHHELRLEDCVVQAGEVLTILLLEHQEGKEPYARCRVEGRRGASSEVLLPMSCCGQFYEHNNTHAYSLRTILAKPRLLKRHFYHLSAKVCGGPFRISPIYQVQAIMHLRKNVVNFPSSLEVDVMDVTEQSKDITFVMPMTLAEVMSQPQPSFPTMAEVLEGLEAKLLLKCHWLQGLQKGQKLVLHGCRDSPMVLASTLPGKRAQQHFLISLRYGGRLRLRPREFATVYELHVAARRMPGLSVTASKHSETLEEGLNSLSAGDQLEVLRSQTVELPGDGGKQVTEVLVCRHLLEADDDEDEDEDEKNEEVHLPMYLEGPFVEKIKDKKKYSLANMVQRFALPLDVKVATRDTDLQSDPLADFPALRLKEALMEPVVVASLPSKPLECFELPSRWLKLSLCFSKDPLPWADRPPEVRCETVIELTEAFYYEFHKLSGERDAPPPLPPKRTVEPPKQTSRTTAKDKKNSPPCHTGSPHTEMSTLKLSAENVPRRPPPPPPPPESSDEAPAVIPRKLSLVGAAAHSNTYSRTPKKKKQANCDYEDYEDYEEIDENVRNAQESIMFY